MAKFFQNVAGTPSAPEKLHYTNRSKNTITLAWQPPRTDGGSPIRGYYVEKMRSDSTEFEVANRKIFTECCGTIENLSENQEYDFRVKAVNEVGEGDPSKRITVKIQDDESMFKVLRPYHIHMCKTNRNKAYSCAKFKHNMKEKILCA